MGYDSGVRCPRSAADFHYDRHAEPCDPGLPVRNVLLQLCTQSYGEQSPAGSLLEWVHRLHIARRRSIQLRLTRVGTRVFGIRPESGPYRSARGHRGRNDLPRDRTSLLGLPVTTLSGCRHQDPSGQQ